MGFDRKFVQDFFSVFKSKAIIIGLGIVNVSLISRQLGPELNGVLASIRVYPELFITFGALGIRQSVTYLIGRKEFDEERIYSSLVHVWYITSFFSVAGSFLLILVSFLENVEDSIILLVLLTIPFTLLNTYFGGIFLGQNRIKEFNQIGWLPTLIYSIGIVCTIGVFNLGLKGVLGAQVTSQFVMLMVLFYKLKPHNFFSSVVDWKVLKIMFQKGLAYAIALLVINLNYRVDVIMMNSISNNYEIGIYTKGAIITQYLWQIPMLISTILFARSAIEKDRLKFSKFVSRLLRMSLIIVSMLGIALVLIAPLVVNILLGPEFTASVRVIYFLVPGVVLLTVFKVINMDVSGRGMPLFVLKSMIPALLVNVFCNLLLVPKLGAIGAALSSTISYGIGAFLFVFSYSKLSGMMVTEIFKFQWSDWDFKA